MTRLNSFHHKSNAYECAPIRLVAARTLEKALFLQKNTCIHSVENLLS
jgi:hypothetical protein